MKAQSATLSEYLDNLLVSEVLAGLFAATLVLPSLLGGTFLFGVTRRFSRWSIFSADDELAD